MTLEQVRDLQGARADVVEPERDRGGAAREQRGHVGGGAAERGVAGDRRFVHGNGVDQETAVPDDAVAVPPGSTGAISFAGATLARLRGLRARAVRAGEPVDDEQSGDASGHGPQAPAVVLGEENKLRQVITNLMGNAMRFTEHDSPIELAVQSDPGRGVATIDIVDHGEGIPPQIREKIFQRFWRADSSRTRETGGSGLGLAIVSSIVSAHNGHVDVVETPGGGATFRVALPLAGSAAAPQPVVPS